MLSGEHMEQSSRDELQRHAARPLRRGSDPPEASEGVKNAGPENAGPPRRTANV